MAVFTSASTAKWIMQFGIFVFVEAQEKICEAICKVVNVMEIVFLWKLFSFYEKVPFPSRRCRFFSKYFYPNPRWCFQPIFISQ